MSRNNFLWCW